MDESTVTDASEVGAEEQQPKRANFAVVLRNRDFRNLWIGQFVSQVGDYFAFLALMVVVSGFSTDASATTRDVSGLMIAITLPRLFFGVLAGVFVDRWDRRLTMLYSDLIRSVLTLSMIPAFLNKELWLVYLLGFLLSTVGTLFNPAKGALIPRLVPQDQLMSANALSQTSQMIANFIGPALAGATFAAVGNGNEWVAFVIDSLSFIVSAAAIWSMRVPRGSTAEEDQEASEAGTPRSAIRQVVDELLVGLKALLLTRTMAVLTAVLAVTMLGVGALNVLWVAFLKTRFGFAEAELGWRFSLLDIVFFGGMVGASVAVGNFLSHVAPKWLIAWGLLWTGAFIAVMGYLPDYWVLFAVQLPLGIAVAPVETAAGTMMQVVVPNEQLGRVSGGVGTVSDAATLLSMSLAGALGAWIGIPAVFLIAGLLCVAGGLLAFVAVPPIKLTEEEAEQPPLVEPIGAVMPGDAVERT